MTATLTRRAVLGGAAGLGAAGAVGALSACGASQLRIPESAARGAARAGGVMRIARPAANAAETLDPAGSLSAYEYLGALFNRVVKLDRDGTTVPDLAEEWSSNADATEWTFKLRAGVRFHDGRPLTARDVRYTVRHILDPAVASPQAGVLAAVSGPDGVEAVDTRTVRFRLRRPNAEFPSLLTAYQCYVIPDGSAEATGADAIGASGIGTGPFRLESFAPAGQGSVVAHDDHFAGRPTLDRLDFYSVQDTSARVNALLARQVDLLLQTNLDTATARVVVGSPGTTVARVPDAQWYTIPMLATSREFRDPLVRQAMKYAYDPEQVLSTAIQGTGSPGWDNPVPPTLKARVTENRSHDPDRARSLLRQAGIDGLRTRIFTSSYEPNLTPIAVAYAQQVAAAGIDLEITSSAADSYYTSVWLQAPLMVSYWFTGRPVDQLLNQIFRSGSGYNEAAWSDPGFDRLLDAARADTDDVSRAAKYAEAQRLVVEDGADMTPIFGDRLVGMGDQVVNYDEFGFELDYLQLGFAR